MRRISKVAAVCLVATLCAAAVGFAGEKFKATPVASGLDNPSGVAVHPTSGHVFVCARTGVYRYVPAKPHKLYAEVTGYSTDIYGKGPKYNIGPLGIALLDKDHIVVGDGSQKDGQEVIQVFKIGSSPPKKAQTPSDAVYTLGPITAGDASVKGEGNFYGVAVNKHGIFVTSNGDDTKGWIVRSEVKAGKPGPLTPFITTKTAVAVDAPVGITNSPRGKYLVVAQMGEMNVPGDSLLTKYDPATGNLLSKAKTGLNDIAGLAYSPVSKKLYVVDFSWVDPSQGGLFRLDVQKRGGVMATKILSLNKPTALAFDAKGNLYVTVFGTTAQGSSQPAGALLKIDSSKF